MDDSCRCLSSIVCKVSPMQEQLVETWRIHNRINLYLLAAISPEALVGVSPLKGRSVGEQFAHMHNVRLMWLQSAASELLDGFAKIEKEQSSDKELLHGSLEASGEAIAALLNKSLAAGGKIKGFKPHAPAFLGYMISHESYHRGEIGV